VRLCAVGIVWYDAGKAWIRSDFSGSTSESGGAWTQASVTLTAPSNAAYATIAPSLPLVPANGEVHYVDKLDLHQGADTTWRAPVTLPNNQPVLQFDGGDDWLYSAPYTMAPPVTVYLVGAMNAGGYTYMIDLGCPPGQGSRHLIWAIDKWAIYAGVSLRSALVPDTLMHVHTAVFNGASSFYAVDGRNGVSGDTGTNDARGFGMAAQASDGAGPCATSIAAFIVFPGAHDAATRQRVERWLGKRFAIAVA
jgi:hypothetical protein